MNKYKIKKICSRENYQGIFSSEDISNYTPIYGKGTYFYFKVSV